MILEIKGKDREVNFNVGFIRRLDEKYNNTQKYGAFSFDFGTGLAAIETKLVSLRSVTALAEVIHCAVDPREKIELEDVDAAIDAYAEEHGELKTLMDGVIDELKNAPVVAVIRDEQPEPATTEKTEKSES